MVKVDFGPLIQGCLEGTLYILTKTFCYKFIEAKLRKSKVQFNYPKGNKSTLVHSMSKVWKVKSYNFRPCFTLIHIVVKYH